MQIKRREFLKATLAAGAATAFGGPVLNAFANGADHKIGTGSTAAGKWMPSTCEGCTTWCAIEIFVQDGRAVKVRGNQRSKSNHGHVCPRGHLILQQVYDPDRVKVPMKRTNPKKGRTEDPRFVPISWDEAMGTIADKMLELRRNNEAHKFVLFRGRYTYLNDFLYDAMPKIFGSPNNISHSSLCAEAEKFGWFNTDGLFGYHDFDLEKTKYVLIWGADPVASNRMVPNAIRRFGDFLDQGTLAVVDPRLSTAGSKAHEWLPVKPGEDGALATAMAHVILTEGLWSREFVGDFTDGKNRFVAGQTVDEAAFKEQHTHGLVKWWNLEIKDRTPEWAEKSHPAAQGADRASGQGVCAGGPLLHLVARPRRGHAAAGRLFRHGGERPERPGRLHRPRGWRPLGVLGAHRAAHRNSSSTRTTRPRPASSKRRLTSAAPRPSLPWRPGGRAPAW